MDSVLLTVASADIAAGAPPRWPEALSSPCSALDTMPRSVTLRSHRASSELTSSSMTEVAGAPGGTAPPGALDRDALAFAASVQSRPPSCRRSTVACASEIAPESESATRLPAIATQLALPPVRVESAVTLKITSPSWRSSCALIVAAPRTSCASNAASGARSGSRSSRTALCGAAVAAWAASENSRCVIDTLRGRVDSCGRNEASILSASRCRSPGCGPGIRNPSMIPFNPITPPPAERSARSDAIDAFPGRSSRSTSR